VAAPDPDLELVERLRAGDEDAFMALVRRLSPSLLRVARMYVPTQAVAEEVVQETWLGVLNGIGRFEGRSTLKTWIFRILVNRARTRGERERRTVPFAALAREETDGAFEAVDLDRFTPDGSWGAPPRRWEEDPELALRSAEAVAKVRAEVEKLPEMQRLVITMRDLDGLGSEDVRNALEISETNQRVLLHRARSKVRTALEDYFTDA
jgi:RNA polymerase sigma-70 factor, ECF subfamily